MHISAKSRILLILMLLLIPIGACSDAPASLRYLSDSPDIIAFSAQAWGELGIDCAAHATQPALPLRIADSMFKKGLGTHASGETVVELNGQYAAFRASVGLQWQDSEGGSVVFKVFVDDKEVFNSDVMRKHDLAKTVDIPLKGADELRLVVTDAGDGIACDCANWADAALVADPSAAAAPRPLADISRFAKVQTWDPSRMDGARNNRIQAFKADELFLGTELSPKDGSYALPIYSGTGCIGLEWIERRRVRQLGIAFHGAAPSTAGALVQYWAMSNAGVTKGGSTWQGRWEPLPGKLSSDANRWTFDCDWSGNRNGSTGTLKIRWVIPSAANTQIASLTAYTDSRWVVGDFTLRLDSSLPGQQAEIEMYNGEIVTPSGPAVRTTWDLAAPLTLSLRYTKPRSWKNDRTVIRLKLPAGGFGVAVEDLMVNDCIYVKDYGVFATREPAKVTMEQYRKSIAGSKTILQQVREMPDQTLDRAMKGLHRPEADLGPTLLSLACDNHKFLLQRNGRIEFDNSPQVVNTVAYCPTSQYACALCPELGLKPGKITRSLAEGWMPIPTITLDDEGVVYRQRTFVAPSGDQAAAPDAMACLDLKPLCVSDFTIQNPTGRARQVSVKLKLLLDAATNSLARVERSATGASFLVNGKPIATATTDGAPSLSATVTDGALVVAGTLPAKSSESITVCIPGWDATPQELAASNTDRLLDATKNYWERVMEPATRIDVPDPLVADLIRASQVHCLLAARNEDGRFVAPWIASMNYGPLESEAHSVIRGMMLLGQTDFARRSLDFFIKRYNPEGFLTTGYTTMGTGWHLWTLGEFCALTHDSDWLKRNAAEVDRVCRWASEQRAMTMQLDSRGLKLPEYGLMPPGLAADWEVFAYYAYLNGYYAAGLREAGNALAAIGWPGAPLIQKNGIDLSREIMRAFRWTQSQAPVFKLGNGTWVPEYPTHVYCPAPVGDAYVGEDAGRSWCYDVEIGAHHLIPMGVMDPSSREADWMLDHMEDVQFLKSGWGYYPEEGNREDWFNRGGFAKVQPYYARNAEAYALRDDVKPFVRSYFNSLVTLLNREDLSMWEHFFNGAFNKTHETGYFLCQTRTMLLTEREDELWLAPFVTGNWLRDGMRVGVANAPSRFGSVGYTITSHVDRGYIDAVIDPPTRTIPSKIVLRLRHPEGKRISSLTVNGAPQTEFDPARECITLEAGRGQITVRARY